MFKKSILCLLITAILLCACAAPTENPQGTKSDDSSSTALTWNNRTGYDAFWELLEKTYPDIEIERTAYAGGNRTGYSWAQLRAGNISDIFVTSQILDREVAKRELADLSGYDFISGLPTSVLDHVSIDGGVYLLPIDYAMYGILYNKTLMEEHGWELPKNFAELEALCKEIEAAGLIPGVMGLQLTGNAFSTVFNLAKTDWFTTPEGGVWERDFLAGDATATGTWRTPWNMSSATLISVCLIPTRRTGATPR